MASFARRNLSRPNHSWPRKQTDAAPGTKTAGSFSRESSTKVNQPTFAGKRSLSPIEKSIESSAANTTRSTSIRTRPRKSMIATSQLYHKVWHRSPSKSSLLTKMSGSTTSSLLGHWPIKMVTKTSSSSTQMPRRSNHWTASNS